MRSAGELARSQKQRRADTRRRLLEAAGSLFAEHGIDSVSVDSVAAAAGRTSGAVYDHFGSKDGLLLALLDDWRDSLVAVILAEFEVASDLHERLLAVSANLIVEPTESTRKGLLLEQQLVALARRDKRVEAVLRGRAAEANAWLARGLSAWVEQCLIPKPVDVYVLARTLRAVVTGLLFQARIEPEAITEEVAAGAIAVVLGVPEAVPALTK